MATVSVRLPIRTTGGSQIITSVTQISDWNTVLTDLNNKITARALASQTLTAEQITTVITNQLVQDLQSINSTIENIEQEVRKNKGYFNSPEELRAQHPVSEIGDEATVKSNGINNIWSWSTTLNDWQNTDTVSTIETDISPQPNSKRVLESGGAYTAIQNAITNAVNQARVLATANSAGDISALLFSKLMNTLDPENQAPRNNPTFIGPVLIDDAPIAEKSAKVWNSRQVAAYLTQEIAKIPIGNVNVTGMPNIENIPLLTTFVRGSTLAVNVSDPGRGGPFRWVAAGTIDTATNTAYVANNITVFNANDGGFWVRMYLGGINPLWIGCNGLATVSDTANLKLVFTEANRVKKSVACEEWMHFLIPKPGPISNTKETAIVVPYDDFKITGNPTFKGVAGATSTSNSTGLSSYMLMHFTGLRNHIEATFDGSYNNANNADAFGGTWLVKITGDYCRGIITVKNAEGYGIWTTSEYSEWDIIGYDCGYCEFTFEVNKMMKYVRINKIHVTKKTTHRNSRMTGFILNASNSGSDPTLWNRIENISVGEMLLNNAQWLSEADNAVGKTTGIEAETPRFINFVADTIKVTMDCPMAGTGTSTIPYPGKWENMKNFVCRYIEVRAGKYVETNTASTDYGKLVWNTKMQGPWWDTCETVTIGTYVTNCYENGLCKKTNKIERLIYERDFKNMDIHQFFGNIGTYNEIGVFVYDDKQFVDTLAPSYVAGHRIIDVQGNSKAVFIVNYFDNVKNSQIPFFLADNDSRARIWIKDSRYPVYIPIGSSHSGYMHNLAHNDGSLRHKTLTDLKTRTHTTNKSETFTNNTATPWPSDAQSGVIYSVTMSADNNVETTITYTILTTERDPVTNEITKILTYSKATKVVTKQVVNLKVGERVYFTSDTTYSHIECTTAGIIGGAQTQTAKYFIVNKPTLAN